MERLRGLQHLWENGNRSILLRRLQPESPRSSAVITAHSTLRLLLLRLITTTPNLQPITVYLHVQSCKETMPKSQSLIQHRDQRRKSRASCGISPRQPTAVFWRFCRVCSGPQHRKTLQVGQMQRYRRRKTRKHFSSRRGSFGGHLRLQSGLGSKKYSCRARRRQTLLFGCPNWEVTGYLYQKSRPMLLSQWRYRNGAITVVVCAVAAMK